MRPIFPCSCSDCLCGRSFRSGKIHRPDCYLLSRAPFCGLSVDRSEVFAFSTGGQAWDVTLLPSEDKGDREVKVLARYAAKNVLASGWLSGEMTIAGRAALVMSAWAWKRRAVWISAAVPRADLGHFRLAGGCFRGRAR